MRILQLCVLTLAFAATSSLTHSQTHSSNHSHDHHHGTSSSHSHDHHHGTETENLFGFTLGSDTENAGARSIAVEAIGRFGKRDGSYSAVGKKLEFAVGITDDVSAALALFADYHRIVGVTGLEDVRVLNFNGIGGEVRWRLVRRGTAPFGVTLHIEPSRQLYDELTGLRATKLGSENKLIFDTELIADKLFAAFNLIYDVERVREVGILSKWEQSSRIGLAAAGTLHVAPQAFVGGEIRYLRAYEGLVPKIFAGDALFIGPTLFWRFASNAWVTAAWNVQVAGKTVGQAERLDLINFERQQFRVKIGVELDAHRH